MIPSDSDGSRRTNEGACLISTATANSMELHPEKQRVDTVTATFGVKTCPRRQQHSPAHGRTAAPAAASLLPGRLFQIARCGYFAMSPSLPLAMNCARASRSSRSFPDSSSYCQKTQPFVFIWRPVTVLLALSAAPEQVTKRSPSNSTVPSGCNIARRTCPLYFRNNASGDCSTSASMSCRRVTFRSRRLASALRTLFGSAFCASVGFAGWTDGTLGSDASVPVLLR